MGGDSSQQSNYDLCMTVDPKNAAVIYVASINVWKSTNSGVTWSISANWNPKEEEPPCPNIPAVHSDHHSLDWSPVNGNLYLGNDGGVYYTANGGTTWKEISAGLGISQIYRVGQSATSPSLCISGFQDNGTGLSNGSSFTTVIGGDGMDCMIDYSDTNYRWGSYCEGRVYRKAGLSQKYEIVDPSLTLAENFRAFNPRLTAQTMRNQLGHFMFVGDTAHERLAAELSGGEVARLALAMLTASPLDILVLDEPTNNLDAETVGVMVQALQDFPGAVITISHNINFLADINVEKSYLIQHGAWKATRHLPAEKNDFLLELLAAE